MTGYSRVLLYDGAQMAYEVLGSEYLGHRQPIVLIGGMSSLRGDWERLATSLAHDRPVLVFDHRGMGDSTFSTPAKDDDITIESLARDIVFLVDALQWKEVSVCGFSMGGVIAQQILFLPYHPQNPSPLPFRVTHVLLTGTFSSGLRDKPFRLPINTSPSATRRSHEEKRELTRPILEASFDPQWLTNPVNAQRLDWWLDRMTSGRPMHTILMQLRALNSFNFSGLHNKIPQDIQFLVIHGELDQLVPFHRAQDILRRIPWAKPVEIGGLPGQVENLAFGHQWFEYFDIQVWRDVVETFLSHGGTIARL